MAFSQSDLDAMDAAVVAAGGKRRVRFKDEEVEFQSFDEWKKLRDFIEGQIQIAAGTTKDRYSLGEFSKG